jgi:hypothetical protein
MFTDLTISDNQIPSKDFSTHETIDSLAKTSLDALWLDLHLAIL